MKRDEILRRLRAALAHPRQVEADQLETAYRVRDWIRWAGLGDEWRVHVRDRAISIHDGRRFHPLERPRT